MNIKQYETLPLAIQSLPFTKVDKNKEEIKVESDCTRQEQQQQQEEDQKDEPQTKVNKASRNLRSTSNDSTPAKVN